MSGIKTDHAYYHPKDAGLPEQKRRIIIRPVPGTESCLVVTQAQAECIVIQLHSLLNKNGRMG